MDNNDQRPNAALINREWFESARRVLSVDELGALLVNAVEYVLHGETRSRLSGKVSIAFEMVRSSLDSDVQKYRERCARNAANAKSQWQRVAASGSESQRVAANTTTTSTSTTTSTTTSLSNPSEREKESFDRWLVFGYFCCSGSGNPDGEFNAFWSYYESLGWKNNKGAAIVSRLSCARMWHRQFENVQQKAFAGAWFNSMKACKITDFRVWKCYAGAEIVDDAAVIRMRVSKEWLQSFEDECKPLLLTFAKAIGSSGYRLERAG